MENNLTCLFILFFIVIIYFIITYILTKRKIKHFLSTVKIGDRFYMTIKNLNDLSFVKIFATIISIENENIKFRYDDGSEGISDAYTFLFIDNFKKIA